MWLRSFDLPDPTPSPVMPVYGSGRGRAVTEPRVCARFVSVLGLAYLFRYFAVVVLVIFILLLIGGDVRDKSQLWLDSGRNHVLRGLCVSY